MVFGSAVMALHDLAIFAFRILSSAKAGIAFSFAFGASLATKQNPLKVLFLPVIGFREI